MTDKAIRHLTTAAVLLVAAIAAVISFIHIRHLALTHGQDALSAALLPLSIDGLVAAMSGVMLRAARLEKPSPWLTRPMLFLGVGATLAANLAYGAAYGLVGALVSGWPAVAFVGCVEVSVAMVRRTRPVVTESEPSATLASHLPAETPDISEPLASRPVVTEGKPVTTGQRKTTAKQEAVILGKSQSTIQRWRRDGSIGERLELAMANGNGKH